MEIYVHGLFAIIILVAIAVLCAALTITLTQPPHGTRTFEERQFYALISRWLNYHGELEAGTPSVDLAPKATAALDILVTADDIDQVREEFLRLVKTYTGKE